MNSCLDSGYTLHHRPRNTGIKGGGVGVLINPSISNERLSREMHEHKSVNIFTLKLIVLQ